MAAPQYLYISFTEVIFMIIGGGVFFLSYALSPLVLVARGDYSLSICFQQRVKTNYRPGDLCLKVQKKALRDCSIGHLAGNITFLARLSTFHANELRKPKAGNHVRVLLPQNATGTAFPYKIF